MGIITNLAAQCDFFLDGAEEWDGKTDGLHEALNYHNIQSHGFFAHLVKEDGRRMRQTSHRISNMPRIIGLMDPRLDNYISQAEFIRPNRRVVNLLRINLNFIDLDFYKANLGFTDPQDMAGAIRIFCDDNNIPIPSFICSSGRGLYLKWLYERAVPRDALPRWNAVQRRLVDLFKPLGADPNAKDASRVLRLMGTTNTKNNKIVRVIDIEENGGSPVLYSLDYMADAVLKYTREECAEYAKHKADRAAQIKLSVINGGKSSTPGLRKLSPFQLNWDRLEDIRKLAEIRGWTRNGIPEGHREIYLFWATNFMILSGATHFSSMYAEVDALAREVAPGMGPEMQRTLSSLYRKAVSHSKGETVEFNGKKYSPLYTPKNQTLIDALNITHDEEKRLKTIISTGVAAERHRKRDEIRRRAAGEATRAEYVESRGVSVEMRRVEARLMRAKGMKQREIAAAMKISIGAVNAYLKSDT